MSLGETIYRLRAEKNLSQGSLADMLGVSRQSISKWENNSAVPDLEKIVKLSDIFEVSLDELVKGEAKANDVKANNVLSEAVQETVSDSRTGFPPRKIAGTILFCMAFFAIILLLATGNGLTGLILATPFLICGIICFVFHKNAGLWCAWAVYALFDIYMAYATGIGREYVLYTAKWTKQMNYMRLAFAWGMLIALLVIMVFTVIRLGKLQELMEKKAKSQLIISWGVVVVVQAVAMIWPRTVLFGSLLGNVFTWGRVYQIISRLLSWARIIAVTVAVVKTVRYVRRNK